ncbi:ArsR/SmtB family transcription factor [Mariluticola halotolerans]|uniref:ArsR/SmtB family transcription factor n=1 Tax=Mariluticola halotolerans TaxID=2909283 RepID=UPI0034A0C339
MTQLLAAMANQKRLMILCHLLDSEKSVSEIADLVELRQSPLSQHLAKLRALGIVATRRAGQSIMYRLSSYEVEAMLDTLYRLYCNGDERGAEITTTGALKQHS